MSSSAPLIRIADLKKIFYTDEVETHALAGIDLDIHKGDYVSIAGPSGCGKSTSWRFWVCSILRRPASTL